MSGGQGEGGREGGRLKSEKKVKVRGQEAASK